MHFISIIYMAMAMVAPATALRTEDTHQLAARNPDYSPGYGYGSHVYARQPDYRFYGASLVKRARVRLEIPKRLARGGSIRQNEVEDTMALGRDAMREAGFTRGTMKAGWHGDGTNTKDPIEHFDIQPGPDSGPGSGNGIMHVYRNGAWSQGPGGRFRSQKAPPSPSPPPSPKNSPKPASKPAPKPSKPVRKGRRRNTAKRTKRGIHSYHH